MSKKTLNFDEVQINNKRINASKQAIDLHLVDINKILIASRT